MLLYVVIGVISIVTNIILGFYVYVQKRKSATNLLFFLLNISIALWSASNILGTFLNDYTIKLFWVRMVMFSAVILSALFFLFIKVFPEDKLFLTKFQKFLVFFWTPLVSLLTLSSFVFPSIIISQSIGVPSPMIGKGIIFFGVTAVGYVLAGFYYLINKYRHASGVLKTQQLFLLIGVIAMFVLMLFFDFILVVFFNITYFINFSSVYTIVFVILASYAIIRYKMFNAKIITAEALIIGICIFLFSRAFASQDFSERMINIFIFILVLIFGILLIRSIRKEVEQRQRLEVISNELQIANTRLKELDQQKTDFLSIAAHQLRTPMSVMNGYIELIEDNAYGKVTKETKTILDNMDQSNQHLIKLVDEFLDITRIEQGRTKFDIAEHNLIPTVSSVVEELSVRAKEHGLKINWKEPKQQLIVAMDDEKIRHVVYNFIDNAIKYSDSGVITLTVQEGESAPSTVPSYYSSAPSTVEAGDKSGVIVKVKDEGLGFGKTDEANFFQKFFRGSNVKHINVNGTGLGLFVCRKFIEAHGGHIWAHSTGLGRGSEFGFWIPKKQN